jgi:UPF0755 protein
MTDDRQGEGRKPGSLSGRSGDDVARRARDDAARRVAQSPSEALHPDNAPPPPKKKRPSALAAASGLLTFLLVATVLAGLGMVFAGRSAREPGPLTADKVVVIPQGSDSDEISQILVDQGVIDSRVGFTGALFIEGLRGKLKAGEYLFKQGASLQEAIDTIVQGKSILHALTIPEGLTSQQIVAKLREDDSLAGEIREVPREGALLPETYKFQRGDSRDKLLQKMNRDQKALVDEIWRRRNADLPLTSSFEMVTLASIVEKETGRADERPRVASVFLNRLRKRMRLQSDPTVVYGLVGGQGQLGHAITRDELDARTPYNTYQIEGLPPGPIANPGRAALEAVANPSRTNDLYFVADGTGGHVFADTLDAHNKNVLHWRQLESRDPLKDPGKAKPGQRTEAPRPSPFGALPVSVDMAAAPVAASRLKREASALNRLAPGLPGAPPAPGRVGDLALHHGVAPQLMAGDDPLANAQMGGLTRAENELDGPSDALGANNSGATARRGAAALDGPAPDIEGDAMAYAPVAAPGAMAANGKPKIYDASAGTALDPLLDKSWDLNSPKTVDRSTPFAKNAK